MALPAIEWVLAVRDLNNVHARATSMSGSQMPFVERALRSLQITLCVGDGNVQRIPQVGPLVVVANHPFGGIDGLALLALLNRRRPDVKILANNVLRRVPELADDGLFVDPFGGPGATRRNLASMRAALRWVKSGGALAVFPAGEVSSLAIRGGSVADIAWNPAVAGLIRASQASVLPAFFEGHNSNLFHSLGLLSPWLRTVMLPREMLAKRGSTVAVHVGRCIPTSRIEKFETSMGAMGMFHGLVSSLKTTDAALVPRRSAAPVGFKAADIALLRRFAKEEISDA